MLKEAFLKEKIEYFAPLAFKDVKTANERLLGKLPFSPKSVIVFLVPYYAGETVNVSRYAASLDYHIIIRELTDRLIVSLKKLYPEASFCGFGDHSPIAEQHAALISGLGILGDNGLLINERYGSYVFIGDIITDVPPEALGALKPKPISRCTGCGACKGTCPTGILRGEGENCLSAITQRRGELSEGEKQLIKECGTVWGCDVCQSVCPYNRKAEKTPIGIFHTDRISYLTREGLDAMSDAEFSRRAFAWRGREVLERNLEIAENKEE